MKLSACSSKAVWFTAVLATVADGAMAGIRSRMHMRIINGSVVKNPTSNYSFFALPTSSPETDQWMGCGASIISPTYAMSAAHCFGGGLDPCSGPKMIALWLGDVELQDSGLIVAKGKRNFRVEATLECNPAFDGKCSHGHDVALLKLSRKLPSWVKPVPLDLVGSDLAAVGKRVTSVGFGLTESEWNPAYIGGASSKLRKVTVSVLQQDSEQCKHIYGGGYGCSDEHSEGEATNRDQQICAGAMDFPERDTCAGDSGSPMVDSNGVQVGIVSYGGGPGDKKEGPGRSCGDPEYPGVYSRVSSFSDFIRKHVTDLPGAREAIV